MATVKDFAVTLTPEQAASAIIDIVTRDERLVPALQSPPGVLLDNHRIDFPSGTVITLIYAKYYARVGSWLTLVAVVSDLLGGTAVHLSTGGHKRWLSGPNTDLGASAAFIVMVEEALAGHLVD